ncbi:conserved hypothetical protein [gamma proteobacterium NOR5-3]|nr:conserved hypothetical protein [gamma proteobacterium NOR5-3]
MRFVRRCVGALLGLCLFASNLVVANDDVAAIRATVFDYFDGINEVSLVRLERAFDENAALKSVDQAGGLSVEPIANAIDRWMQGDPAQRRGEILSIDLSDGPIARVVFDYDGAYLDFLTLAKLQGQWKIIDKVFIRVEPPSADTSE